MAWAWCWEAACEHIPGGRSTGSFTSTHGQTRTQQAEEVVQGGAGGRPGLEEMEVNPEGTPSNPSPMLFLRKLGCSCLVIEVGEDWMLEVNLHRESPIPSLKRRDSGSLEWNKLFGGRHRCRRAVQ